MLSLIIAIIECYIVYKLFENKGLKEVIIFKLILQVIKCLLNMNNMVILYNNGFIFLYIVIILMSLIVFTLIESFVFNKTEAFLSYFIVCLLLEFLAIFVIAYTIAPFIKAMI